ncbi:MAG TPA: amidase [Candidatus Dormibacteraeota bacterium]|nr:amidase [Candidatus Dormibacteraeota bacterium]
MDPFASALEQAAAVRRRDVSSTELTLAYLERIEKLNPRLNAFVLTTPELALEQAKAADAANIGYPLRGVPTSVKDIVSLAGYPLTFGSKAFEDYSLPIDFFPVARLKEEGCPILGKTNLSEFGTRPTTEHGLFGATHNPWHLDHSAGGSSGGAAAAVAAGLCAFAHGSDGGGSVRIPASCCGVVGLKPSRGRISAGPLLGEHWAGLSTDGAIARTVGDAAAGLDAMAGHLPGDAYWSDIDGRYADAATPTDRKLRIGFALRSSAKVDEEVARCVRDVARLLEGLGHRVTEGGPDTEPFRTPMQLIVVAGLGSLPIADESKLDPFNALGLALAKQLTAVDYVRSVDAIRMHSRIVIDFWETHDILITPTLPQTAPRLNTLGVDLASAGDEYMDFISFTFPFNCTGQPAISLPLGVDSSGLPIGVQLVGPPRGEAHILGLAAQLEQAMPWSGRRPRLN